MLLRLSFRAVDSFWNWLIDTPNPVDPVSILVRRPSPTTRGVRPKSVFVHIKLTMGTGIISESIVYETGGIRKTRLQIPIQLVGRHVYVWDPHRKKIPAEGERHPINSKERRGFSRSAFCSLPMSERRWRGRPLRGVVREGKKH
jgi:hypothetical protein